MANKKGKLIYGIIGLGRFGLSLAIELAEAGEDLIALDKDENKVSIIREYTENAYVVRNLEKQTLIDSGLKNCDVVVVCIAEQMDKSLLTTLNLVSMGIPKIIAKATSLEHGQILEKIGAEVVYPEHDMAVRLANRLETSSMLDFVQLSEKINISKVKIPNHIIGKTVLEIDLRAKFGLNIIAIENGDETNIEVMPEYRLRQGDIIVVIGKVDNIDVFVKEV